MGAAWAGDLQQQVQNLFFHQPIGEYTEMGEWQNAVISILKNIVKPGMQGGFPAHEIDDGRVFDFWQKLV